MKALEIELVVEGIPKTYSYFRLDGSDDGICTYRMIDKSAEIFPKPIIKDFTASSLDDNTLQLAEYIKDYDVQLIRPMGDQGIVNMLRVHLRNLKISR
jgi:hypothetical protein